MAADHNLSDPMRRLLLVGTVHADPNGYRRTLQLLERLRPQLILIELSPFGLTFRRSQQRFLWATLRHNLGLAAEKSQLSVREALKHPQIRSICRQMSLPFEYRAAANFAPRSGTRLLLVDDSSFSRHWIATWPELITAENLLHLLSLVATSTSVSAAYTAAANRIASRDNSQVGSVGQKNPEGELWTKRELFMANRVGQAMRSLQPTSAVYLGGWWHLTSGGACPTLREILHVPRRQCCFLDRAQEAPPDNKPSLLGN